MSNIFIYPGKLVGSWVLLRQLKQHHEQCEIWVAKHNGENFGEVVLKFDMIENMTLELRMILDYFQYHENYTITIPRIFRFGAQYMGDLFGTTKKYAWVAMKKCDNDLRAMYRSDKRFANEHYLTIMNQCIGDLIGLHFEGYTHGDVKAENILIKFDEDKPSVYLSDYGLAENSKKVLEKGRPEHHHKYYMSYGGMYPDRPCGLRCDYEGLGIAVGLAMKHICPSKYFTDDIETVKKNRRWENLKDTIPECLHRYFQVLSEILPWSETKLPDQFERKIRESLKMENTEKEHVD